ncbi:MAG: hypothetical protein ABIC04_02130 [Nanoarchaeota archaeon]
MVMGSFESLSQLAEDMARAAQRLYEDAEKHKATKGSELVKIDRMIEGHLKILEGFMKNYKTVFPQVVEQDSKKVAAEAQKFPDHGKEIEERLKHLREILNNFRDGETEDIRAAHALRRLGHRSGKQIKKYANKVKNFAKRYEKNVQAAKKRVKK